jgi:hypothetical protein
MYLGTRTICLGERKLFLQRLDQFLAAEAVVPVEVLRRPVGSVEVIVWELRLKDGILFLEYDPMIGKSLVGPHHLVDRIAKIAFGLPRP